MTLKPLMVKQEICFKVKMVKKSNCDRYDLFIIHLLIKYYISICIFHEQFSFFICYSFHSQYLKRNNINNIVIISQIYKSNI